MVGLPVPAVRCGFANRRPEPSAEYPLPRKGNGSAGLLFVSKPSWIVRTESNVHKTTIKRENPACVICLGTGRIDCRYCHGKGRTNCSQHAMLPKGEWPEWCKTCRGSGLEHCRRCLGTGQYRDIMGFHFMKMSNN
ncbi:hypothetical protein ZOSMA_49G01080 [Zostera marina]|uniref:Uncharacterized protein n=1 Tax=Zostera marina TaxID=29655 RepID=A0A0K9NZ84_ZOSMR|nr:hypothetical protein ZOSMA_49G01080 [Zostera marina]